MLKKFIGDKAFYRRVLFIAVPIIIQNAITNFVALLDNIMVGQVGTIEMSGVSIVNQLMFVFNLCIFGAVSGAGIFTAQYFGSNDDDGVRHTLRFKIISCAVLTLLGVGIFVLGGEFLINQYLKGEGDPLQVAKTLKSALGYLKIMLFGLLPFALSNAYASTLRETNNGAVPMVGGVVAVFVNLVFNYILIFGKFGAPAMGVKGAAIATVLSRYVELAIVAGWSHINRNKHRYFKSLYRTLRIPGKLFKDIMTKGMPLLINEAFWASGMAILNQCYSTRGYDVVAALNISTTLFNLASVVYLSMGNTVGIIIGQMLGAGKSEKEVRAEDTKLIATSVLSCFVFGLITLSVSGVFPMIYNTTDSIRTLATQLICVTAVMMPFNAYLNSVYFTLRSGGQTAVTFIFDSLFVWTVCVPLAYCISEFTSIRIVPMFFICHAADILKSAIGAVMIHQGKWLKTLVGR